MKQHIIPTPRHVRQLPGAAHEWTARSACRIAVATDAGASGRFVVRFLMERLGQQLAGGACVGTLRPQHLRGGADIILCGNGDRRIAAMLPEGAEPDGELPREQGYVIHAPKDGPVILFAHQPIGLLYAGATFLQLLTSNGKATRLQPVEVRDTPAFRRRGNSWLIRAEISGWSYARGDGAKAYEQRILRKLDLCALNKINFLHFDGFDWNTRRFPGYAPMMRRLNHAAGLRGIRLSFGGYGAVSDGLKNQRHYPHGDAYACIGSHADHPERFNGTCLSNRALTAIRKQRLADFVKNVRPGALYVHGIDTGYTHESHTVWALRCPACRKRWPDDDVISPRGMAGAYAAFYDDIAKAVRAVDPQCLINVVSPGYTGQEETDAQWEIGMKYWLSVSRCLKDRNIQFGLREQFAGEIGTQPRYAELRDRLQREAKGHRITSLHFFGGDCFYNSHPFIATPTVSRYFEGADLVVHGNGHAYQEPQQLLNAECLWNPTGSAYFKPPKLRPFELMRRDYRALSSCRAKPAGVWGKGGFLDVACERLYGDKAGPLVATIHRLFGKANLRSPGIAPFEHPPVMMPMFNYLHPSRKSFQHAGLRWQADFDKHTRARRLVRVYGDVVRINRQAAALARRAARVCADAHAAEDLRWMADTLALGGRLAALFAPFVELFMRCHAAVTRPRSQPEALRAIDAFAGRIDRLERRINSTLPRAPRSGGRSPTLLDATAELELTTRRNVAAHLRRQLESMRQTLLAGQWPEPNPGKAQP